MDAAQRTKLMALPLHVLSDLFHGISDVYEWRLKREAHRGYEIEVDADGRHAGQRVWVTGSGPKNLTGYCIDHAGNHLRSRSFRCHPTLARVVAPKVETAKPKPAYGTAGDRPASMIGSF
jgi:hypothetical protein